MLLQKPHPERERLSEGPKNAKIQELPGAPWTLIAKYIDSLPNYSEGKS